MSRSNFIHIWGAKENNLKSIDVQIPKHQITVVTGVSGSGKSSLVFDTIAAESQRLLNETYSTFIQHRLQQYGKPNVDEITNLPASIVLSQKRISGNARSTVGTITDIFSLLRLLYSRLGEPFVGYSNIFSFNHVDGMCSCCSGLGKINQIDIDALLNFNKSLNEGAIRFPTFQVGGWRHSRYIYSNLFDNDKPLREYSKAELDTLLYADDLKLTNPDERFPKTSNFEGLIPRIKRTFLEKESAEINGRNRAAFEAIVHLDTCPECHGQRLNRKVLSCKIANKSIGDCADMSIEELYEFIRNLESNSLSDLIKRLAEQLHHLITIGLGYLTLNRETSSLSGGESQRVKLVRQLGCSLVDLIYILDEPSVGLHPYDIKKIQSLLKQLCEKGNTVLIVDHDPDIIAIADYIVEIGPKAGREGGEVVFQGDYSKFMTSNTATSRFMNQPISFKSETRPTKQFITVESAKLNNLKDITAHIPLHAMSVVTGVAGSGKSSLCKVLLTQHPTINYINQSELKGSKRSNIATYTGIMEQIRDLFAKENSVKNSLFSTNSLGACSECKGSGVITTDLAFMDAVETKCEKCRGTGYNSSVLKYLFRGKDIVEVMQMTIQEAYRFFAFDATIAKILLNLMRVGLGYITLRQPLSTLSGGERQRVKLAIHLDAKNGVYLFDEPTTGLHGTDIGQLLKIFDEMIEREGATIIIIEHDVQTMVHADWLIDVGLDAGKKGGTCCYEGVPSGLLNVKYSHTAEVLRTAVS